MTVRINGTTVIDSSRNLVNIANQDQVVNTAFAPMHYGFNPPVVGTYAILHRTTTVNDRAAAEANGTVTQGDAYAGSTLTYAGAGGISSGGLNRDPRNDNQQNAYAGTRGATAVGGGTWRAHGRHNFTGVTLFVRIT